MADFQDVCYVVPSPKPGSKDRWVRVGVAFPNKLGGLNISIDVLPVGAQAPLKLVTLPSSKQVGAQAPLKLVRSAGNDNPPAPFDMPDDGWGR
jgi:hypothetical protein